MTNSPWTVGTILLAQVTRSSIAPVATSGGDSDASNRVILCSDGVNKSLDDPDIVSALDFDLSSPDRARSLVETARDRGSNDDITVICIDID